jgi:hypothetical protein
VARIGLAFGPLKVRHGATLRLKPQELPCCGNVTWPAKSAFTRACRWPFRSCRRSLLRRYPLGDQMVEEPLITTCRQKAADLRAFAAQFVNNISVYYELLKAAESYDHLAEAAERRNIVTAL